MSELTTDHYRMLLGLDEDWSVDAVTFGIAKKVPDTFYLSTYLRLIYLDLGWSESTTFEQLTPSKPNKISRAETALGRATASSLALEECH